VDLDETLVRTNTLVEAILSLVRSRPLFAFLIPVWLFRGQAYCWSRLARLAPLDVSLLPYRDEVVSFLREEKARGRTLVLVTGAHLDIAERIAAHFGFFSRVIGTSATEHLVRQQKTDRLVRLYGERGYDYVGATGDDLPPCLSARVAYLAGGDAKLASSLQEAGADVMPIRTGRRRTPVMQALRPHQWMKNLLVFAPVLLSHRWSEPHLLVRTVVLFAGFCLLCSAIYIINDLLDLESDRRHTIKKHRPFASGLLNPLAGIALSMGLLAGAAAIPATLGSIAVAGVLSLYAVAAISYSIALKRLLIIDVAVLAGLYCVRVYAGGVATGIPVSPWTFAFSLFGFMSLALMKRYSELYSVKEAGLHQAHGRGYAIGDLPMIGAIGVGSGLLAVLVLALYITSPDTSRLYSNPQTLSLLCPAVLIGVARLWVIAGRGEMNEDPVLFALGDKFSIVLLLCAAIVGLLAI
jgi:4-hydroxybenzoate polyprenyltransferase